LERTITVTGLPFSPQTAERSIDDLSSRSLCRDHNSQASVLDDAAIDMNNALRRLSELQEARTRVRGRIIQPVQFRIDGRLLERWALKTVMNISILNRSQLGSWRPPGWLAEVVFGRKSLPAGCGIALVTKVGENHQPGDQVDFAFGTRQGGAGPEMAMITLRRGFRFFLTWDVPIAKVAMTVDGEEYFGASNALMPFRRWNITDGARDLRLALCFDWEGPSRRDPNVVRLRKKYKSPPRS